jgi:pectinesterase
MKDTLQAGRKRSTTISFYERNCAHVMLVLLLCVCFIAVSSSAQGQQVIVTVTNSQQLDRPFEMIVLPWNKLHQLLPGLSSARVCILDAQTKDTLLVQCIDEDHNGTPEELIFNSRFKGREKKKFIIMLSNGKLKAVPSLTDARFMRPREDIAWENDRIAYRIYGPALGWELNNGLDVWTKRVRYPIVEKWYKLDEADSLNRISYHEDHGEGADLFNVWKTLGAGSCALMQNDSLCQPGVFSTYKILATGPIRSLFEVTYRPVQFNGQSITEKKRITLDAGSNLNKVEVTYSCDSSKGKISFAAGLVKRKGVTLYSDKENRWVSLWGLTNEKRENGSLGTGIVITKEVFNEIKEDSVHVLFLGTAELGVPLTYYTGAGWTRSGDFNNADEWNKYLGEFSMRIHSPLKIMLEKK